MNAGPSATPIGAFRCNQKAHEGKTVCPIAAGFLSVVIYTNSGSNVLKEHFKIAEVYADAVFLAYGVNGLRT